MSNPIPEERYILKQDLWKRIDKSIELINASANEVNDKTGRATKELLTYYNRLLESLRESKEELKMKADNELSSVKKELESFIQEEVDRLILGQNEFLKKIDSKFIAAQENMDNRVRHEIDSRMTHIEELSRDTNSKVSLYEMEIKRGMANLQNEIMGKFNDLRLKFEKIISNMRGLANIIK